MTQKVEELSEDNWGSDLQICGVSGSILLALYLYTMHPSVAGGDSGELIVSAYELGVAHPPGYPLFTLLSKAAMILIPFGQPAWRVNVLNACFSALTGATLQLTVLRVTSCFGSSLLSLALFSLSRLTWTWASAAEVFALNNFLIALIILMAVIFEQTTDSQKMQRMAKLGSVVCALALCNQHTSVVYVAFVAVWVLLRLFFTSALSFSSLVSISTWFCVGLLPYLYLPVSSFLHMARWTWGDQRSLSGFMTHFLRSEYGTFQLGKDQEGMGLAQGLLAYWSHFCSEYTIVSVVFVVVGSLLALKRAIWEKKFALFVCVTMVMTYVTFFAWRANLNVSNPLFRGVVERFWMQSDFVFIFLLGIAFNSITRTLTSTFCGSRNVSLSYVFACMAGFIITCLQLRNFAMCHNGSNLVVRDFGSTLLKSFPKNSLILTKGDLPTNAMRYLHLCESHRPDVTLLDVEILSYEWSLPRLRKFYSKVNFPGDFWHLANQVHPDGRKSFNFKNFLDANYDKSEIFVCIGMQEKDPSWQTDYQLWPHGPCHRVISSKEVVDPSHWAGVTGSIADKWHYHHDGYDNTTWEKVANDEMWNAKISSAFFFYQQAELNQDLVRKTEFLENSYQLYLRALQTSQPPSRLASNTDSYPSFWHKNFALVCERLLRSEQTSLSKLPLCKLSIQHFKQYLSLSPNDPDAPKIASAIEVLQERLEFYAKMKSVDKTLDRIVERAEKRNV